MKISKLIEQLQMIKRHEGDIEVTCTAAGPDCPHSKQIPTVYESTVEQLRVLTEEATPSRSGTLGKRVRLWW